MKKLLTLAAVLGTAATSFGQGYVSFANSVSSRVSNGGALQGSAAAGSYYYALLVAPSTQNTVATNSAKLLTRGPLSVWPQIRELLAD